MVSQDGDGDGENGRIVSDQLNPIDIIYIYIINYIYWLYHIRLKRVVDCWYLLMLCDIVEITWNNWLLEFTREPWRTPSFSGGWAESYVAVDTGLSQGFGLLWLIRVVFIDFNIRQSRHVKRIQEDYIIYCIGPTGRSAYKILEVPRQLTNSGTEHIKSLWVFGAARSTVTTGTLGTCPACEINSGQSSCRRWRECVSKKRLWSRCLLCYC